MEPIKGNSLNKSCGDIISSNCVTWAGGAVSGVCGPNPTLTQVIQSAIDKSGNCCEGEFPSGHQSCYTGDWVNFSSSIPASGVSGLTTWTISSATMGASFSGIPGGTGAENSPQYKWTQQGDLKVRGSFIINISPGGQSDFIKIPLVTLSSTCFPTNFNAAQSAIIGADAYGTGNMLNAFIRGYLTIDYPSCILYLNISFFIVIPTSFGIGAYMGGTTFNLA